MAGRDPGQNMNQGSYQQPVYSQQPMMPAYGFDARGMAPPGHMQGYKQPPQQQFGTRTFRLLKCAAQYSALWNICFIRCIFRTQSL